MFVDVIYLFYFYFIFSFVLFRISVTRSNDIPFFGPPIPEGAVFDKNENFRDFLLTKCKLTT